MTKIDQIKQAIQQANFFKSKLTPEALAVPGFTSLKIRHLMNNLGAISKNFLEIGSHKGGTYCSGVFNNTNLDTAIAVDNFSEFNEGSPMIELLDNISKFKPRSVGGQLISRDCWSIGPTDIPNQIDFYLYDGEHAREAQRKAVSHFLLSLANEFIFCVDDYSAFEGVKEGTEEGIKDSGCQILFEQELYNGIAGDNHGWHNGFYVALLKKS